MSTRLLNDLGRVMRAKEDELDVMRGVKRTMMTDAQTIREQEDTIAALRKERISLIKEKERLSDIVQDWINWYRFEREEPAVEQRRNASEGIAQRIDNEEEGECKEIQDVLSSEFSPISPPSFKRARPCSSRM